MQELLHKNLSANLSGSFRGQWRGTRRLVLVLESNDWKTVYSSSPPTGKCDFQYRAPAAKTTARNPTSTATHK